MSMMLKAVGRGVFEALLWVTIGSALMALIVGALVAVGWLVRVLAMGFTV